MAFLACVGLSASIGASTGQAAKIFACANKRTGNLRVVGKHTRCRRSERKISWGKRGAKGARGARGPAGSPGPAGPGGPSSYAALGPLTIPAGPAKATLYDLGYGVQIQVKCSGDQTKLTPEVFVTNTAENTYLSAFSAGPTYSAPRLEKMATAGPESSLLVSSPGFYSEKEKASVSSQVFISVLQLSDTNVPKMFYATVVPWAEAQTTTCKFAGGITRVAG